MSRSSLRAHQLPSDASRPLARPITLYPTIPINLLVVRALLNLHRYEGEGFKIECPTGSSKLLTRLDIAEEIAQRIFAIFR